MPITPSLTAKGQTPPTAWPISCRASSAVSIFALRPNQLKAAKKAIKKAFQNQLDGKGFSLVEVVSSCPTNWGLTPQQALKWIDEKMLPYYPLGVYKDRSAGEDK